MAILSFREEYCSGRTVRTHSSGLFCRSPNIMLVHGFADAQEGLVLAAKGSCATNGVPRLFAEHTPTNTICPRRTRTRTAVLALLNGQPPPIEATAQDREGSEGKQALLVGHIRRVGLLGAPGRCCGTPAICFVSRQHTCGPFCVFRTRRCILPTTRTEFSSFGC